MSSESEHLPAALYAMEGEIECRIDAIVNERSHLSNAGGSYEWTISRTREMQLLALSHYVLDIMSEQHDTTIAIDIECPEGLLASEELPDEAYFSESPEEASIAVAEGAELGLIDFLEILAPEDVDSLMVRRLHYRPWERKVVESAIERGSPSFFPINPLDASLTLHQPTRLPNIEVVFYYGPDEDMPRRIIKVKNEQVHTPSVRHPQTSDTSLSQTNHYESMLDTHEWVRSQATTELHSLAKKYAKIKQENSTNDTETITLLQQAHQLHELLSHVLAMSEIDAYGDIIPLDDPDQRLTDPPQPLLSEEESPLSIADMEAADQAGLQLGTADFLSFIVPSHIKDSGIREIYFSPWRKNLFEQHFPPLTLDDTGALSLSLPTAIPNIDLKYTYEDGSEHPLRTLFVNKQHTLP